MDYSKDTTPEDEPPRLEGIQFAIGEEQRGITNSSTKNEVLQIALQSGWVKAEMMLNWGLWGDESKVQCCKEQYYIGK